MKKLFMLMLIMTMSAQAETKCDAKNSLRDATTFSTVEELAKTPLMENVRRNPASKKRKTNQEFYFPIYSLTQHDQGSDDPRDGYRNIVETSPKLNEQANRIELNCIGFIQQIAFYKETPENPLPGAFATYQFDNEIQCMRITDQINKILKQGKTVCLTLDFEYYEEPKVEDKECEAPIE